MMKLPLDFIGSLEPYLGDAIKPFLFALDDDPVVSIRLNPLKTSSEPLFLVPTERVPWSPYGYYLKERPAFTYDPLLHSGAYYVQEASSMFVEHVIKEVVDEPAMCLDLCAAPGGKSLSLLSALPEGSFLVSNEVVRQRAHVLAETIVKFGSPNSMVTNNAPADFGQIPHSFDLILVDAPCSGEGMFRKDAVAVEEWSTANVKMCAERQQDILKDIWPALKPGGLLIYSTCTYNVSENEAVIWELLQSTGASLVDMEVDPDWGVSPSFDERVTGYRFFPHRTRGEGLSLFVLKKAGGDTMQVKGRTASKRNHKKRGLFLQDISMYSPLLRDPGTFRFLERSNRVLALPELHADKMAALDEKLKTVCMGIEMGEIKGRDFVPAHALALSWELNPEAFSLFSVTYEQAIAYLRKEALVLPDAPKGLLLLAYEDEPMGFAKNVGNRANNLYPSEWRIRSGHLPESVPRIFSVHA